MGNLLGAPITDKHTHTGKTREGVEFGVSSMQGWRIHMEDAHICQPYLYAEEEVVMTSSSSKDGDDDDDEEEEEDDDENRNMIHMKNNTNEKRVDNSGGIDANDSGGSGGKNKKRKTKKRKTKKCSGKKNKEAATTATAGDYYYYNRIPLPGHSLYAVFDGHGGTFAAEYSGRNLCRVLSRQEKFIRYAKCIQERAAEKEGKEGDNNNSNNNNNSASGGGGGCNDKEETGSSSSPSTQEEATYNHELLQLLERALQDAFIELDRELLREIHGLENEDANTPYGDSDMENDDDDDDDDVDDDGDDPSGDANKGGNDDSKNEEGTKSGKSSTHDTNNPSSSSSSSSPDDQSHPKPSEDEDSGTTAVVVILTPKWIICANAGDSRAVYSKNGRVVPLSYDHKPDDEEEERRIRDAGGYVAGGRVEGDLAVSRGLGDFRFKDIDTVLAGLGRVLSRQFTPSDDPANDGNNNNNSSNTGRGCPRNRVGKGKNVMDVVMLQPEDQKVSPVPDMIVQNRNREQDEFIIVACDGIWDVQTNHECVKMVAEIFAEGESNLGLVCEEVLDICLRRGSKDNMTALVIKFEAQKIGEGGGVLARRELREAAQAEEEGKPSEGKQRDNDALRRRQEFFAATGHDWCDQIRTEAMKCMFSVVFCSPH